MTILIFLIAFVLVAVATLMLFRALKLPAHNLLFSLADARKFQDGQSSGFLFLAVCSAIFGTLTSLATVYVFFLGTAKVFGVFVFAAPASIILSFLATNWLTRRALENRPDFANLIQTANRASGVVARLVWSDDSSGRAVSSVVKWISLINIISVIWLEFSVFGDLASSLWKFSGSEVITPIIASTVIMFFSSLTVIYLLMRYGLRGFIFADVLHSPLVVASTIAVLFGLYVAVEPHLQAGIPPAVLTPLIPVRDAWLFVAHVFALNLFFVLVTEGHWFRLWLFAGREVKNQMPGTLWTGAIWAILAAAGCLAVLITSQTGTPGVAPLIEAVQGVHPALALIFWIGASAALFSVADAQIYNLLMVSKFRPRTGLVGDSIDRPARPLIAALGMAAVFAAIFYGTRYLEIPFEKLVFALFPSCLNVLPAFLAIANGRRPRAGWVWLSILLYSGFTLMGFLQPSSELAANLTAALMPVLVSIPAIMLGQRETVPTSSAGNA